MNRKVRSMEERMKMTMRKRERMKQRTRLMLEGEWK